MGKRKSSDCPLYKHPNGQWMKKIAGKAHYFGTDLEEALRRYALDKDRLAAGLKPLRNDTRATLAELGNIFCDAKKKAVASGELERITYNQYERALKRLVAITSMNCLLEELRPIDFVHIKEELSKPSERDPESELRGGRVVKRRSALTVGNDIRAIRVFFSWVWQNGHIDSPVRTGTDFSPPSLKNARRKRATQSPKLFTPEQVKAAIEAAGVPMKAIILLAINGGIGGKDIANMTVEQVGTKPEWLNLPRLKTGAPRRVWLWPETVAAVEAYRLKREHIMNADQLETFFLTRFGVPWIRSNEKTGVDMISHHFSKLSAKVCPGRTFYDLRRTFRTVGGETLDIEAVQLVMGHAAASGDMGAVYNQRIGDDRIKAVCEHVRKWLFGSVDDCEA
ncbi:MAG: site-specific integrase [Pirellulaceae bacterium]|nr:site-specific integrase [Pirellulaceae bacterium]